MFKTLFDFLMSNDALDWVLKGLLAGGLVAGIWSGFFKARKIQPKGFKWLTLRNEAIFATVNLLITAWTLGPLNKFLRDRGLIAVDQGPAAWWLIALEFGAYFLLFDTWFYWLHRWMHKEPMYGWVHKLHHKSTSPNVLTTFSVNPLESMVNGGFLPVFLTVSTLVSPIHQDALVLIVPFNIIMGLYVHLGYEFLPRWWNKTWATKWFITATFHDQHHKYFNYNFGGYTQIWDYLMGTVRKKYESDFENPKARQPKVARDPGPAVEALRTAEAAS